MNLLAWLCVAAINVPLLLGVGRILFGGWRGFWDACEALTVFDLSSALSGETPEPRPGKFLMLLFLVFAIFSTMVEYYLIAGWLGK